MLTRIRASKPMAAQVLATGMLTAVALGIPAAIGADAASAGTQTTIPDPQRILPGTHLVPAPRPWRLPVASYRLTARFGASDGPWSHGHTGLDFAAPPGTHILAIAPGVVVAAAYDGPYGNKTVVRLHDGTELWFCHQTAFAVSVGQQVRPGDLLGYVGSTGNVTGPHLHLEVHPGGGDPVDPYAWLQQHGLRP